MQLCLTIKNEPNLTSLSENIVIETTGLRRLKLNNCSLNFLPSKLELMKDMVYFDVSNNNLTAFNVNITAWEKLTVLHMYNNSIVAYNTNALWNHANLNSLHLGNNVGLNIGNKIRLPSLLYLNLDNNQLALNTTFDIVSFPNILFLYINGNEILNFPDRSLNQLVSLGVARGIYKRYRHIYQNINT